MRLWTNKQIILGDGNDSADIYIDGDTAEEVTYSINGAEYTETLAEAGVFFRYTITLTCDTPNQTVIVSCGGQSVVIYSVGSDL